MENLTPELLTQGGLIGFLSLFALMFLKGWIVPKGTVDDIKTDRDAWRSAAETAIKAMDTVNLQLTEVSGIVKEDVAWHRSQSPRAL